MRRREFEIRAHAGVNLLDEPRAFFGVFDKPSLLDRLFRVPRHPLVVKPSAAACHQWVAQYRQAEQDVAAFHG